MRGPRWSDSATETVATLDATEHDLTAVFRMARRILAEINDDPMATGDAASWIDERQSFRISDGQHVVWIRDAHHGH